MLATNPDLHLSSLQSTQGGVGGENRERDSKDNIKLILSSCLLYVRHHGLLYGQVGVIHIDRCQKHHLVETKKWQS